MAFAMDTSGENRVDAHCAGTSDWFETTHWSVVVSAGNLQSPQSQQALARLDGPVAFLRRRKQEAETHAFVRALRLDAGQQRPGDRQGPQ